MNPVLGVVQYWADTAKNPLYSAVFCAHMSTAWLYCYSIFGVLLVTCWLAVLTVLLYCHIASALPGMPLRHDAGSAMRIP
jgi:hypothetical protein